MSADRLAEIKARAEAATPGPSMVLNARMLSGDVFIDRAREDVPWLVSLVESLTAERDALVTGRCMADITLCDDERRLVPCVLPDGHRAAHDDLLGTSWTDGTHYGQSEVERLRAKVARVQALLDSNPDHADTCGSVLTPGAGYPCSCWQADLRAALAGSTALDAMGADQ